MTGARSRPAGRLGVALLLGCIALTSGCQVVRTVPPTTAPPGPPGPAVEPVEAPRPDPAVPAQPRGSADEVRAAWVVRFTLTSDASVRAMVDGAHRAGINTLIVQVRGRADAFYDSALEPRGESIRDPAPFDPLALTIELAHARGMTVHAWVNTHLVWGPAELPRSEEHLLRSRPQWLAVPRSLAEELLPVDPADPRFVERLIQYARDNSNTVEGVYTSPSDPQVQDRVHDVWVDLAERYDLDGLHFDYIRFPSARFDYSISALERFRLWLREHVDDDRFRALDTAYEDDLFAMVDGEPELWGRFRREQVDRLVSRIQGSVRAIRPELTISAAVIADQSVAYEDRFQDWPSWLERGWIDVAVPMAYTRSLADFDGLVRAARAVAGDPTRVWAGIGAYMNPAETTIQMIDLSRAADAGGVVLFSYDWIVEQDRAGPGAPYLERVSEALRGR